METYVRCKLKPHANNPPQNRRTVQTRKKKRPPFSHSRVPALPRCAAVPPAKSLAAGAHRISRGAAQRTSEPEMGDGPASDQKDGTDAKQGEEKSTWKTMWPVIQAWVVQPMMQVSSAPPTAGWSSQRVLTATPSRAGHTRDFFGALGPRLPTLFRCCFLIIVSAPMRQPSRHQRGLEARRREATLKRRH